MDSKSVAHCACFARMQSTAPVACLHCCQALYQRNWALALKPNVAPPRAVRHTQEWAMVGDVYPPMKRAITKMSQTVNIQEKMSYAHPTRSLASQTMPNRRQLNPKGQSTTTVVKATIGMEKLKRSSLSG